MKVRCPTCEKSCAWTGNDFRPFCSERCRILDLGAWADDRYRIAGEGVPEEEDDGGAPY